MGLPYDMGNAGDLPKHGVVAEFVQWRCESRTSFRFIDLFGGLPWGSPVAAVAKRVQALPDCALRRAQTGFDENRYYGSGLVARHVAEAAGIERIRVLASDLDPAHRAQLHTWPMYSSFRHNDSRLASSAVDWGSVGAPGASVSIYGRFRRSAGIPVTKGDKMREW